MKRRLLLSSGRFLLVLFASALSQGPSHAATTSAADKTFAKSLSLSIQFQIAASELAEDKALSQKVKHTGNDMHVNGLNVQAQLDSAVKAKGITLPVTLDAQHAALLQALVVKTGIAFDTTYLADILQDHAAIVAACTAEAKSGKNAALRNVTAQVTSTYQGQMPSLETLHTALSTP